MLDKQSFMALLANIVQRHAACAKPFHLAQQDLTRFSQLTCANVKWPDGYRLLNLSQSKSVFTPMLQTPPVLVYTTKKIQMLL